VLIFGAGAYNQMHFLLFLQVDGLIVRGAYKRGSYQRQFTVINLFLSRKYRKKSLGYTSEIVHATEIRR